MNQANILIVEDDKDLREALADTVELAGFKSIAAEDGSAALKILEKQKPTVVVSDIQMKKMDGHTLLRKLQKQTPNIPVIMMTAHGNVDDAVQAMRCGAMDYLTKPFKPELLIKTIEKYLPHCSDNDSGPVAEDPKSKEVLSLGLRVAGTDATVLISGESGSGKEVLARYIHDHSPRKANAFVAINCAAIPESMLEATLFGYEKGAFTGAYKSTPGKFEQAQGGTLLLDEISEMDLALQAKLLRVLQEKEVERIGGRNLIPLDVRVLATTNRDMQAEVKAGHFREDLFYRLNVFPLLWVPLRERKRDILPMAKYLLERHTVSKKSTPKFSPEAETALENYTWPGNARELENVIQRALVLQVGDVIEVEDLQLQQGKKSENLNEDLKDKEYQIILQTLEETNGNKKLVAEKLGVSDRTLRYKLSKMRKQGLIK